MKKMKDGKLEAQEAGPIFAKDHKEAACKVIFGPTFEGMAPEEMRWDS